MPNIIDLKYEQTGASTKHNKMGMRDMQAQAYEKRAAQYLLIKAPPASGKSRALMFLGLDKLHNQGLKKVIVAVPERSIGSSFAPTDLSSFGFFTDWNPSPEYNLCTAGDSTSKVKKFVRFLNSDEQILICTHATLRFAYEQLEEEQFNDCVLAIDEFHHVSSDNESSRLGNLLGNIMAKSNAHVVAMTGSYFRGDGVAVLSPDDEANFDKVTYNYYEQLNGYSYLKTLGIGYHFYQGKYTSAISEVLDTDKKTIIHIPSPNAGESTKDKYAEVDTIIGIIGEVESEDFDTGVINVKRKSDGKIIKVANLVHEEGRERVQEFLRNVNSVDDIDIIIALGMAKEGFDWPYCEHALTVGYRGSLTEVIQIIGRCTRDSDNKSHAQFTNLIIEPDAASDEVNVAVNNMLKAITCSLLMEQIMAPVFKFKPKLSDDEKSKGNNVLIKGLKVPSSKKVKDILESDLNDLKAKILQDKQVEESISGAIEPEIMNKVVIPRIIREKYPDLDKEQVEEIRQHVVADSVLKGAKIDNSGDQRFLIMSSKFINIDELEIDLIDKINPFQDAYEIMSKNVDKKTLKAIKDHIDSNRSSITEEEALYLWQNKTIQTFVENNGSEPDLNANNPLEVRMAEALAYLRNMKRQLAS